LPIRYDDEKSFIGLTPERRDAADVSDVAFRVFVSNVAVCQRPKKIYVVKKLLRFATENINVYNSEMAHLLFLIKPRVQQKASAFSYRNFFLFTALK
jgi:hypothetical protein